MMNANFCNVFFSSVSSEELENRTQHSKVVQLVEAYRSHGHKTAHLDPLNLMEKEYGLFQAFFYFQ